MRDTKYSNNTAKMMSESAIKTQSDYSGEWRTNTGNLYCKFRPTGRVEITWRHDGGLGKGYFMKDWPIETTLEKWADLLNC